MLYGSNTDIQNKAKCKTGQMSDLRGRDMVKINSR